MPPFRLGCVRSSNKWVRSYWTQNLYHQPLQSELRRGFAVAARAVRSEKFSYGVVAGCAGAGSAAPGVAAEAGEDLLSRIKEIFVPPESVESATTRTNWSRSATKAISLPETVASAKIAGTGLSAASRRVNSPLKCLPYHSSTKSRVSVV